MHYKLRIKKEVQRALQRTEARCYSDTSATTEVSSIQNLLS